MLEPQWKDNPQVWTKVTIRDGVAIPDPLPPGSGRAWLVAWASVHDDFLFVELFLAVDAMEMLEILNRATGLEIPETAGVDTSCKIFLRELEAIRCERIRIHG
ncbi:hypothetical protein EX011_21755 [Salmonella enterica]|nr:hypothetical protein [Salmonella enterica]EAW2496822.1 hypothetical protein [Salmonella enterica subsp. enterica]HAV7961528.1 hypothetical protein [Escherichia coli]EBL7042150.1 hypothetical protein [Salmonella enterica]EHQ9605726.1 hypothetical protein [Salmonella enterica]